MASKGTSSGPLGHLLQWGREKFDTSLLHWRRCPEGADEVPLAANCEAEELKVSVWTQIVLPRRNQFDCFLALENIEQILEGGPAWSLQVGVFVED